MRQLNILCTILLLILTECNANHTKEKSVVNLPKVFYIKLQGTIGDNIPITMDLERLDSSLSGSYYYNRVRHSLSLNGKITIDSKFQITESNDKYEETGVFNGVFISPDTIEGVWVNSKTKAELKFKLSETKDNTAKISISDFHKENCRIAEANKKEKREGLLWCDTLCSYINVHLITVDGINKDKINKVILDNVCRKDDKHYRTINDLLNSIDNVSDEYYWEVSCHVITNENNILCLFIRNDYMGCGNPHPWGSGTTFNFDLMTGEQIQLSQLLVPNYSDKLNQIGERDFVIQNKEKGMIDFTPGKFELGNKVDIHIDGLYFACEKYATGRYVPGVFLSYKEIKDLIPTNSLLTRLAK